MTIDRQRLPKEEREGQIMRAALTLSEKYGYKNIKRGEIAAKAKCSPALVSSHFGNMEELRKAIMKCAIKQGRHKIVLQGLATNDPIAKKASDDVKEAASKSV